MSDKVKFVHDLIKPKINKAYPDCLYTVEHDRVKDCYNTTVHTANGDVVLSEDEVKGISV